MRMWQRRSERPQAIVALATPHDEPVLDGIAERIGLDVPVLRLTATDAALGMWQHFVHVMLLIERLAPGDPTGLVVPARLNGINRRIDL